jgi:integrase
MNGQWPEADMAIRKRRDGFQVLVYAGLDPITGRQRYISRQVNGSRREAERLEARLKTQVADGGHVGTRARTLTEMVDIWLDWRASNGRDISPRTLDDYRNLAVSKIAPGIGRHPLGKVNPRLLDAFYQQLRREGNAWARSRKRTDGTEIPRRAGVAPGLSASRVHDVHVILSGALGLAARWGWIAQSPATVARPAMGRGVQRPLPTPEEVRELFAAVADDPEFAAFLRLSATTGLRPGEVCALRWVDVDPAEGRLSVTGNIVIGKGLPEGYVRKPPKSDHGVRHLALDQTTAEQLREHQARRQAVAEEVGAVLAPEAFVFSCEPDSRQPIRPNTVAKRFTKKAKALRHSYTLYGLRHFMATQLGAVASANTVRSRMGHGSLAITSIYAHPVEEADRAAAQYMGDLLDGRASWHPARSLR